MGRKATTYNIVAENLEYLNNYASTFENASTFVQYGMTLKKYLNDLGETSAIKVKPDYFENYYTNLTNQQKSHIRGFYIHILKNNLGNAKFHINKSILIILL